MLSILLPPKGQWTVACNTTLAPRGVSNPSTTGPTTKTTWTISSKKYCNLGWDIFFYHYSPHFQIFRVHSPRGRVLLHRVLHLPGSGLIDVGNGNADQTKKNCFCRISRSLRTGLQRVFPLTPPSRWRRPSRTTSAGGPTRTPALRTSSPSLKQVRRYFPEALTLRS